MAASAEPAAPALPPAEAPPSFWRQALADLAPFPGRAALTWRIALLCALVIGVAMMYEIPEAAISCYLIIYLMKPDALVNIGTGLQFLVLIPALVALIAWIVNLTQGSTMHIMLAIVISSFILLYIGAASQLGEQGGVVALIIAFILTLIVKAPFGAIATLALQDAAYMAMMPMAMIAGFNLVLGFSPVRLLRNKLRARLTAAADALETGENEALYELLREGNAAFDKQAVTARMLHLMPSTSARQMAADVRAGFALMLAVSALPSDLPQERRATLALRIRSALAALEAGHAPSLLPVPGEDAGPAERAALAALAGMAGEAEGDVLPAPKVPFFFSDALTNPAYGRFALKTTLASVICFLTYTALDWQGIHTAMITCYVAALSTTGETVHKLVLRISGCLVGAVLGFGAIFFVIPYIDDVGSLMALVFFGCLVGAWGATGPERISYAGVQVALAFLLIVVQGFGPDLSFDTGWGRIMGILLGNVVVYLIFTRLWPSTVEAAVRKRLADALSGLARIARLQPEQRRHAVSSAAAVEALAGQSRELMGLLPFEPREIRRSPEDEAALRGAVTDIETLNRTIWLNEGDLTPTADRLDALSSRFRAPEAGEADPSNCTFAQDALAAPLLRLNGAAG